jgi:hypothetical protein
VARAKKAVRKHTGKARIQIMELSKAGTSIDLEIFAMGRKVGTLEIGRGSLTWYGRDWKHGRRFSWSEFADHMGRE